MTTHFKKFSELKQLSEALITYNKKNPKYGNVVIVGGGSGSGKGFVIDNLLGIQGKIFDVDKIKEFSLKSPKMAKRLNINPNEYDLSKPADVSNLHGKIKKSGFFDGITGEDGTVWSEGGTPGVIDYFYKDIKDRIEKSGNNINRPNIIFDVTLQDFYKISKITKPLLNELGYDIKNIHIVWVLDDIESAKVKNKIRSRRVFEEVLEEIHRNVSKMFNTLMKGDNKLDNFMDGDVWLVFNKMGVDSIITNVDGVGDIRKPYYLTDVNYYKIKETGKSLKNLKDINKTIIDKIREYVPNPELWESINIDKFINNDN